MTFKKPQNLKTEQIRKLSQFQLYMQFKVEKVASISEFFDTFLTLTWYIVISSWLPKVSLEAHLTKQIKGWGRQRGKANMYLDLYSKPKRKPFFWKNAIKERKVNKDKWEE